MTPWLSDEELADLCDGLKQSAAQARYLRRLGITVREKPNGRPLVMRSELERLAAPVGKTPSKGKREPNRLGLVATFKRAA